MKYSEIKYLDIANGPGLRISIWFSGCNRQCPGCFNEVQQDFSYGNQFTQTQLANILLKLVDSRITGISILGGEPLDQGYELYEFLKTIKQAFPKKSIWLWTGYTIGKDSLDEIQKDIIECCDVVVDGPYLIKEDKSHTRFRGSSNQRILLVHDNFKDVSKLVDTERFLDEHDTRWLTKVDDLD